MHITIIHLVGIYYFSLSNETLDLLNGLLRHEHKFEGDRI